MKLKYLEGLRGYLAIWVFFIHAYGFLQVLNTSSPIFKFLNDGKIPVIGFIILSGFVTHILLTKGENFRLYITRRFLRLFPIYLVAFFISLFMLSFALGVLQHLPTNNPKAAFRIELIEIYYSSHRLLNVLSHIFLLHGIFPDKYFHFTHTIMGQSWSLTLEWQFYIFIPILYSYIKTKKTKYLLLLILFAISISLSYRYMKQYSFLPFMVEYFLIGYFSYPLYKMWVENKSKYLFIFLITLAVLYAYKRMHFSIIILIWGLVLYFQNNPNKISELLLNSRIAQFFGKISYSIYALHMICLYCCGYLLEYLQVTNPHYFSVLLLITSFAFTIFISYLGNKYIEQYFIDIGRKIAK